ncbi:unnamed protein product [Didymodactylos carnosus]|uniref:SWIM-type domain-containing protein n=2 Tax=Didymodactylos carnosus TaxID=1234261 RepID=A0A815D324_9BILA|nr:unnamed protein product [Didymodactylos carnosus]CAF4100794.1 unnamed protein product [Didymodactylos carnosus]
MVMKWTADKDLDAFRKYFEDQWLLSLPFWYEGSANLSPSTNNGLESLNGKIKLMYTLRNKLSLSSFLQTAERMSYDWSLASANTPFAIQIEFTDDLAARAYQLLQKLDRTKVLHLGAASYVVPSSEQKTGTSLWVQYYHSMSRNSYNEFIDWLNSARLVDFSRLTPPLFCSCKYGLKEYSCVHSLGLLMMWDHRKVPQPLGTRRGKGRPKKVKLALTKD